VCSGQLAPDFFGLGATTRQVEDGGFQPMSEYSTLVNVSEALRDVLWEKLVSDDPAIHAILNHKAQISLKPPYQLAGDHRPQKSYLSVYLFRVQPKNVNSKNQPVIPGSPPSQPQVPVALDMFYVITPLTKSSDDDQRLLDKITRVLHDSPILAGAGPRLMQPFSEQIRISPVSQSTEDLCDLWTAFRQPLRLSVCYAVGPVFLH
jgi:Pvc16 N-terminal domain